MIAWLWYKVSTILHGVDSQKTIRFRAGPPPPLPSHLLPCVTMCYLYVEIRYNIWTGAYHILVRVKRVHLEITDTLQHLGQDFGHSEVWPHCQPQGQTVGRGMFGDNID